MAPDGHVNCKFLFPPNNFNLNRWISFKYIWYIHNLSKVQTELKKTGYSSILTEVMTPDRQEKLQISGFRSTTYVGMDAFV